MDEPAERERRLRETKHLEKTTQHVTENDNLISISPQLSPIERARPLGRNHGSSSEHPLVMRSDERTQYMWPLIVHPRQQMAFLPNREVIRPVHPGYASRTTLSSLQE